MSTATAAILGRAHGEACLVSIRSPGDRLLVPVLASTHEQVVIGRVWRAGVRPGSG